MGKTKGGPNKTHTVVDLKSLRRAVKKIQDRDSYMPNVYWLTEWLLYMVERFENIQSDMDEMGIAVPELEDPMSPPFDEEMN